MTRLLVFACLVSVAARAERPVIDLSGGRVQAYPLALARPSGTEELTAQVQSVLAADFDRSGLFRLLDPTSFLARSDEPLDKVEFARWQAVGAQGLVKMSCAPSDGEARCDMRLYDVTRGTQLLHGNYGAPRASVRQIAHRFGDDVVRFFTQEPGVFQTRIAYVREAAQGDKQIVVADSDGANPVVVADGSINIHPSWTPDGKTVAFTSFRGGSGAYVYAADLATRQVRQLVARGDFTTGAAFSPDGTRFLFSSSTDDNTDVYVSNAGTVRRVTDARGIDISGSWSPDGKRIAFVSERAGTPQIYAMNADGSGVRRLTFQGNYNQEPAWSPKGDLIAFSGRDEKRVFDIYVVNVDTGKVARLTQNQGSNEKPSWAPNGRALLFASTRVGQRQIFSMTVDGSTQRQITSEKQGAFDPAWGPLPGR